MSFDFPSNLFSNPEYNNEHIRDIEHRFTQSGGKILGSGKHATAYYHPKWKYVLKTFVNDSSYIQFVRFVMKTPRQSYPKFFDKPRKIVPNFKRPSDKEFLYIVKMELLFPITSEEFDDVEFYIDRGGITEKESKISQVWKKMYNHKLELERKYPNIKPLYSDYHILNDAIGVNDLVKSNVMKRKNGEFVLADPVWKGESFWERHDRLTRDELDLHNRGEYAPEPEYIPGGKKYKKVKPPKVSAPEKRTNSTEDDLPF